MQGLPCLNPSCKSKGKAHPNCRCWNESMAEGGEVDHFCSQNRAHNSDCQYFDEGGESIPANEVVVDAGTNNSLEIPSDQVKLDNPSDKIPSDQVIPDEDPYATQGQTLLAGAEAIGRGLAGPLAPLAEIKSGLTTKEDIAARERANPILAPSLEAGTLAASLIGGVGEAGLIGKAAASIPEISALGKVGMNVLRGAVETASFAGSDEITKALLDQPGSDPEHPVSAALLNVGAAGLMGAATGGVFGLGEKLVGKAIDAVQNEKIMNHVTDYLAELGEKVDPFGLDKILKNRTSEMIAMTGAVKTGTGSYGYEAIKKAIKPTVDKITESITSKVNPYITDALIKSILTNEGSGLPNAIHYVTQIGKGSQKALNWIEALFKAGASQIADPVNEYGEKQLKNLIEQGQVNKQMENQLQAQPTRSQGMAEGGEITPQVSQEPDHFANIFPKQNVILNQIKGRVSGYLNSIRPLPNAQKLPFDEAPQDKEKSRSYDKAIRLATSPISILDKVNNGMLTAEDMKHFTQMYPEMHRYLSSEMTKRILKGQLKDEKPPYSKRQSMSLFLGSNLDSTLTSQAVMATQAIFAGNKMAQMPQSAPMKNKKNTSTLTKVSQSYLTDSQAREKREQSAKA